MRKGDFYRICFVTVFFYICLIFSDKPFPLKSLRLIVRIAGTLLLAGFVGLSVMTLVIFSYGNEHDTVPADAAVVLGAAAWYNKPSPVLRERVNHAITLLNEGQVKYLIFTGGKGKGAPMAESEVARRYAIQQGVPASQIFIETHSQTTWENLVETQKLLKREALDRILIVSDPFHMKRAMGMAKDVGLNAFPAPTPSSRYKTWNTKAHFLMRETYYYSAYLLAGVRTNR